MRLRYFVRVGVRLAGAALIAAALLSVVSLVLQAASQTVTGGGMQPAYLAGALLSALSPGVAGLLLIVFAGKVARWVAPAPSHRCPECDYSLLGVTEGFCPECGVVLGEEFVEAGRRITAGRPRGAGDRPAI